MGNILAEAFSKTKKELGKNDLSQYTYLLSCSCGKKAYMNYSQVRCKVSSFISEKKEQKFQEPMLLAEGYCRQ